MATAAIQEVSEGMIDIRWFLAAMVVFMLIQNKAEASPCSTQDQITTLAMALYHEGRGEGTVGMLAIGEVIIQRVNSHRWPDDICGVVYQPSNNPENHVKCQFSYTCDDSLKLAALDKAKYKEAERLAFDLYWGIIDLSVTNRSDHYLRCDVVVDNSWTEALEFTLRINNHCFYKYK